MEYGYVAYLPLAAIVLIVTLILALAPKVRNEPNFENNSFQHHHLQRSCSNCGSVNNRCCTVVCSRALASLPKLPARPP